MDKDNNLLECTLILALILLFCYYLFKKHKLKQLEKIKKSNQERIAKLKKLKLEKVKPEKIIDPIKTKKDIINECKIKKEINSGECYNTKVDFCPMGCYKQCTNNVKHNIKNCDCNNRNSLLCQDNEHLSEKCLENEV